MKKIKKPIGDDVRAITGRKALSLRATPMERLTEVRREEALLKAGALQSAIFNSANFSSIATDAKGVIQIFNVGAERMLGYTAAEVMNNITPADISDPEEMIARAKALSAELATEITPGFEALVFKASRGIEDIYELTYIRKDGSRFPAVVSVTALRDAQVAIIGYLLIGTDNTARKQVEEERAKLDQRLRDQQFYTRSLIESNIDALMTTDPAGVITDANKQMEALTGYGRDELIGAPFKNYFTDPERAEAGIRLVLSEKKVIDYEITARARDGKQTVVSYNATTFYDRDGKLQGVFAAARDVTERKRFEQSLQETNVALESAKSAAERANLAKSDFLSSMSHELRSPLNAILGFAQLMESASPAPTAAQKESIDQILLAGWHLLTLINEILDLAMIESRKMSLSREAVSLAEVMSECESMMASQAQQCGIRMTFPRFDNPLFVRADRTRLKQIVINLLSNAIKYNKEGGSVVVDCTVSAPQRVRISVADTGTGLSEEKLAQLFQPFNRLGQESGSVAGTGIGLVVTKRLAELMEGVIGVKSNVGEGSVFWCELSASDAPRSVVEDGEASIFDGPPVPAGTSQRTLLYVEDNLANMKLVEQLVARRSDITLLTAVNGTLGVEVARSAQPTVILMDIHLPGISGIDALKILGADPATAHIPIVALSANAMPDDIAAGLEAGFFRYLTKPIKVKEFMDTLNVALEYAEKDKGMTNTERQQAANILVVDDTPANLLLLVRMLTERGYKARPVSSGRLALEAARAEPPDLILLDITMPAMNGYEVCEQLKADAALKDIPVIFISALNETLDKVKAFRVGAVDYVTKPFNFEEVYARVQTHLQLRQLEKLRDDLTHMVIHDLTSPLTVIFYCLDMMKYDEAENLSAITQKFVALARHSAEELNNMIRSILDVSKMGAGEMKLRHEPCELDSLIRDVLAAPQPLPENRTVTIDIPEASLTVAADFGLIRRVLQNLLSNALRYTPAGGNVRIVVTPSSSEIRIAIADAGPGIAPEYHQRIFQKFGQVEDSNHRLGTGLGLTFCKLAVEAHGGRIGVESEVGKGCTFWFALPRLNGSLKASDESNATMT